MTGRTEWWACGWMLMVTLLLGVNLACSGPKKVPAQPVDLGTSADGAVADTGSLDGGPDAATDFGVSDGPDAGAGDADPNDMASPQDADPNDMGVDAGVDVGPDAGVDAGDAGGDAGPDTGVDAGPDAGADAGLDAGADAGADAGDTGVAPPPTGYTATTIGQNFLHGQSVEVVDIDRDGRLDVVASISLTDTVRLHLNRVAGFVQVDVAALNSIVAMDSASADFDGDGDIDIAVVGLFDRVAPFASPGEVVWYENPGVATGTWIRRNITAPNFYGPSTIEAADIDGDNIADLVVSAFETADSMGVPQGNGVYWMRNTGGAFTPPITIDATLTNVEEVRVFDVDLDGVSDVVASSRDQGQIRWYENGRTSGMVQTQPNFTQHILASLAGAAGFAPLQIDGDAAWEMVVQHDNGNGGAVVRLDSPVNATQAWPSTVIDLNFGGPASRRMLGVGDLNADGLSDFVAVSQDNGLINAYIQGANQSFVAQPVVATLFGVVDARLGDIDGDGRDDIAVTTYDSPGSDQVVWYRSQP